MRRFFSMKPTNDVVKRRRFGIIGCGTVVEELHLPAARAIGSLDLVSLCDSSPARLAAISAYHPNARQYLDFEEFLSAASELDLVVLATPGASHRSLAERIIRRNLHLMCEKPLVLQPADARYLFDLARRQGVVLTCIHNYRFKENVQRALLSHVKGELGDIVAVNVCFRSGPLFNEQPAWRRLERENRVLLFDLGLHFVDIALLFLGPVVSMRLGEASVDNLGIHRVVFTTSHRSGCTGLFEMMVEASNCKTEIEILGERRGIALQFFPNGFRMLPSRETPAHRAIADLRRLAGYGRDLIRTRLSAGASKARSHAELFRRFLCAIEGTGENPVAPESVIETVSLLDEVARQAYREPAGSSNVQVCSPGVLSVD
jgi:predicted dehydrogenase